MKNLAVEISTPRGIAFTGEASVVEWRSASSAMELRAPREKCLTTSQTVEITLRRGEEMLAFVLENVWASFGESRLIVMAEAIRPLPDSPVSPETKLRSSSL